MNSDQKIRVLIADDHPVVREGMSAIISYQPDMELVAAAANGREAIDLYQQFRPSVTLMDLRMPEIDGVSAIRSIRAQHPTARIILLTTFDGDENIYKGLQAGATGYLLKDSPMETILSGIRTVHLGKKFLPSSVAAKLAEYLISPRLTSREEEVLQLIAKGKSNQEIAAALFIVEGTVKAHVANILLKLDVRDRTQAVTEALRRGIIHME